MRLRVLAPAAERALLNDDLPAASQPPWSISKRQAARHLPGRDCCGPDATDARLAGCRAALTGVRSDDGGDLLEHQTLPWRSCNRLPSGSWNIAAKPQGLCSTSGGSNFTPRDFSVSNAVRQSSVSIVYVAGMTPSTGLALVGVPGHRTSSKS